MLCAPKLSAMKLQTWLDAEHGRSSKLAEFLTAAVSRHGAQRRISRSFVAQMKASDKPIPAHLVRPIQDFTAGDVMPWDCRPGDWWLLWPELIDRRGAPELVPAVAPAGVTELAPA